MPSVVTDTDDFVTTVQRPNNGEPADSASIEQLATPVTKRTRFLYNRGRSALFDITRAPYNADPTGGTASTTAIQAALDAAAAAGGHVFSPPGNFRHGLLTVPRGVSIFGVPDKTYWLHDHASANGLVFLNYNEGNPQVIQDIRFLGNIAGTGTHVVNNADARAQFIRCSWNGFNSAGVASNNLQGNILAQTSAASSTQFIDCDINVAADVHGLNPTAGVVRMRGGSLKMPATYTSALARATSSARLELDNVYLDFRSHTTGSALGLSATNPARAAMRGCVLDGSSGVGAAVGFWWEEGTLVLCQGNDWMQTGGGLQMFAGNLAASGSQVELLPLLVGNYSSSASIVITTVRTYAAIHIRNDVSATVRLPTGVVPGQVLHFSYFNEGATAVSLDFTDTPLTASILPGAAAIGDAGTIGAGITLSGTFVWENRDGGSSYRWIQIGAWGQGGTFV